MTKPLRPTIRLRSASPSDISRLAEIACQAGIDDPLEAFLYPYRKEHPRSFRYANHSRIRVAVNGRCRWVLCAELAPTDGTTAPTIAGFVVWVRQTKTSNEEAFRAKMRSQGLPDGHEGLSLWRRLWQRIEVSTFAEIIENVCNRAMSRKNYNSMSSDNQDESYDDPEFKEPEEHWYINEIAVAPEFQRLGIGRALLEWGLPRAKDDGVPILIRSSPAGSRMYKSCGFKKYGMWNWGKAEDQKWELFLWEDPKTS